MINILHKLYPTKKQELYLDSCLWSSIGIENWVIGQIRNEMDEGYFPLRNMKSMQVRSILSKKIKGHSHRCGIPSKLINDSIDAVLVSLKRHKNIFKLNWKTVRRKKSFYFKGDIKISKDRLKLPGLKTTFRMSEPRKFLGKLKKVTLIKKFDGWYAACCYEQERKPIAIIDGKEAGIDPGLKTSMTFSDRTEIDFPRFYQESEETLGKLQRKSKRSKKLKESHRKLVNRRKDHHHKLSTSLAKLYAKIYWSDDNFKGLIKKFGKSYLNLSLGMFRDMLSHKLASRADGFGELIRVSNRNSTKTCSNCGSLSGPSGLDGLAVRQWKCSDCGVTHDRDINAARITFLLGKGIASDKWNLISRESFWCCA